MVWEGVAGIVLLALTQLVEAELGPPDLDVERLVVVFGPAVWKLIELSLEVVGARLPAMLAEGHAVVGHGRVMAFDIDLVGGRDRPSDGCVDLGSLEFRGKMVGRHWRAGA
jgi:hypothetical protein